MSKAGALASDQPTVSNAPPERVQVAHKTALAAKVLESAYSAHVNIKAAYYARSYQAPGALGAGPPAPGVFVASKGKTVRSSKSTPGELWRIPI